MRVPGDARSPMPYNAVGMAGTDENVLSFWGKARPRVPRTRGDEPKIDITTVPSADFREPALGRRVVGEYASELDQRVSLAKAFARGIICHRPLPSLVGMW